MYAIRSYYESYENSLFYSLIIRIRTYNYLNTLYSCLRHPAIQIPFLMIFVSKNVTIKIKQIIDVV